MVHCAAGVEHRRNLDKSRSQVAHFQGGFIMGIMKFDRSVNDGTFTVEVCTTEQRGYFEHNTRGDERAGELLFEQDVLVDYDGTTQLPNAVIASLQFLRFIVPNEFTN
jgi:hypothetical protein